MTLAVGTRLGPYEIGAPLGAGGMGEVYKAKDTRLDRTVAIKVLPQHLSAGAGGTQPQWSSDGKTLYFVSLDDELMAAEVDGRGARLEIRAPRVLFPVNLFIGPRIANAYAIAPDGKRMLAISAGEAAVPRVALVANWLSGLAK